MKSFFVFLISSLLMSATLSAQQPCPQPPALQKITGKNIFTDQQEVDLGDAMGESFASEVSLIDDPTLTAHLDELGARLASYLPPNNLRFRFFLVELPEVNAFSLSGGRIYVARKMVALTRTDDELAGVLAHEMGHIVTHQHAIYMTLALKQVLGVTQVDDRADIYDKFHRLLENMRRKPVHISGESEADQYIADQVALFAMARAGFAPQSYVYLWDRFNATHGKTGSWLSDMFGQTKPEQRRLRELVKSVSAMPVECARIAPSSAAAFEEWQARVVASSSVTHTESLPGLLLRQKLAQTLRPDINNLRFSPDGKFVLAQDDGGIHILTRDPFQFLFFIESPNADKASFTPDSKSVVFKTPSLRVETWDIVTQKRTSIHEMLLRVRCLQSQLSPDGLYMACLDHEFALSLFEVASGNQIANKKGFVEIRNVFFWLLFVLAVSESNSNVKLVNLTFSPDGHYFLAGSFMSSFAFDLLSKHETGMPSSIRNATREEFTFIDDHRILALDSSSPRKSPLLQFPSGERLQEVFLGAQLNLAPAAHGNYVRMGPLKSAKLGFMDLSTGRLVTEIKNDSGDIYDNTVAFEEIDGRIVLSELPSAKVLARAQLTQSRLGDNHAITASSDFNWLAVSTRSRGAVWDISHNTRVQHVRGFTTGWFADDHMLYADFPKLDKQERSIVRLDDKGNASTTFSIGELMAAQDGPYVLVRTPPRDNQYMRKNWTYDLKDLRTNSIVWSHRFPHEYPSLSWTPDYSAVLMGWSASSDAAHEELKQFPDLKKTAEKEDMFYELFDVRTNTLRGKLLVKTNKASFNVMNAVVEGDSVAVQVSQNRTLIYSLSSEKEIGHVFGHSPVISTAAGAYAVSTAEGAVNIHDLLNSQLRRSYKFPVSVAYKRFSPDGKRLFVLTRDQTAYILDLTAAPAEASDSPRPQTP